jgi:hypothetical protein
LVLLVKAEEFLLMAQSNTGECVKENDSWVGIENKKKATNSFICFLDNPFG